MLAARLDFSARHCLCQFMPAVPETTHYDIHFDIQNMYTAPPDYPLEIAAFCVQSNPTIES